MLEEFDAAIIDRAKQDNNELCQLLEEHEDYEMQLQSFSESSYLSGEQEVERKRLQKLKLAGKDRIVKILGQYQRA